MKQLLILGCSLLSLSAYADKIEINTVARYATCTVNQQCQLSSYHAIKITNDSSANHYYNYTFTLCADTGKCVNVPHGVTVSAHAEWSTWDNIPLIVKFRYEGNHNITANTIVDGPQHSEMTASNFAMVQ